MTNVAELIRSRAGDPRVALRFEDQSWTWAEYVDACSRRAAYLLDRLPAGRPPHVGVLLDNTPEYLMWLGATALSGTVLVGVNPTRRGAELARDITYTDCQIVVTETRHLSLVDGLDLGDANGNLLVVDDPASAAALDPYPTTPPEVEVDEDGIYNLLFTSGTSGAPKACILSQRRLLYSATILSGNMGLSADDVFYLAMPLFHSNAVITSFCPWVLVGSVAVPRRRFSASGFLPDVRKYGVTYFNYVGKPLSYILATPPQPDDADNTLRLAFGNEAADLDIERFETRFGCPVVDGYGSTEGGAHVNRSPEMPKGALGMPADGIVVCDPETLEEMPRARFDAQGRLLNPDECIGEMVNKNGAAGFEGYYKNDEANQQRVRNGWYWTGDLAYRDDEGYIYFAGRDFEWIRVDGENFAAAPIERILARHEAVVLAAVYAVPDAEVGDQVMATLQVRPGTVVDPADFDEFLGEQTDLGTKWSPRYVRVTEAMPVTESQKPLKRVLRRERWDTAEPVFWRPARGAGLVPMTAADRETLLAEFARHERLGALDAG